MDTKSMNPRNLEFQTEQEQFWSQEFGDEYTHRNQGKNSIASNIALFSRIFDRVQNINSLIEFGANRGLNIEAIKQLIPKLEIAAIEINNIAIEELQQIGEEIEIYHESILNFIPTKVWALVNYNMKYVCRRVRMEP